MAWFNLTVAPTISSSIVVIDIDSCSIATYWLNSPDQVALKTKHESSCHYTIKSPEIGRKKLHYNSATALHCNSNLVSITRFIMIVLLRSVASILKILNVHLVSHGILRNFVSTQWSEIFHKSQCLSID